MDYEKIINDNPVLESDRLLLRPFTMDDVNDVYLYSSDDVVTKYLTWPTHAAIEQTRRSIELFFMGKKGVFAIESKSEHKCIGCIDLRICAEHEKAEFGYVLNRQYWNNGYMTEALNLILDFSFTKLKINRVEATHYVGNEGSGRVMEKCGMKYEGKGLKEVKIKGTFYDVVHYGILREQWINSMNNKQE